MSNRKAVVLISLNPFYFRAGLLRHARMQCHARRSLNPFYFRAGLLPYAKGTRAHAERISSEQVIVGLQCSGTARIQQERGVISLMQGDIGIVDGSRPFDIEFPSEVERRLVIVPRTMLGNAGSLISKLGQPLRLAADARLAPVIAQAVRMLADRRMQRDDAATSVLLNGLADMVSVQFGASPSQEEPVGRDAFDRVIACIEANLESPILSPHSVAAAAGVSLRTLHRLFRRHGRQPCATFEQCVFDKRLSRAYRALMSGEQASVTGAAFACGFSDLSHFTRRFESRFGILPSTLLKIRRPRAELR